MIIIQFKMDRNTMRTYFFAIILLLAITGIPFPGISQSAKTPIKKDTTLAMLMDKHAEQQLLSILSQNPKYRDSILVKEDARFFTVSEFDFGKLRPPTPNRSVRVIRQVDSIRQILPGRPGIIAILLIENKK